LEETFASDGAIVAEQSSCRVQASHDLVNALASISPYPDTFTMQEAHERFLASNGFRIEDYSAPTYTVKFWRLPVKLPNTKGHQWATPLHDLHHLLTGFRTDWIGEAEIAAWDLRAGCKTLVVYWLDLSGAAVGLFISPQRVWRAFRAAKGHRTLYRDPTLCESMNHMTVGEVRARLGIPPGGLNK
jgi:hypothetical protein